MNCQEAQEVILGWENLDAEMAANPAVAAHIATCAECRKLIERMKKLEATAREMPLPEGYGRVPPEFLRRIEHEATTRKKGCFGQFARRTIAAVLIVAISTLAIIILMFDNAKARADEVFGRLVQWNLAIVEAKDSASRAKLYNDQAAKMQIDASRLDADDKSLAASLLDNAHWLTTENNPQAEGEAFSKLADEMQHRAASVSDPVTSSNLKNISQELHNGAEKLEHQGNLPALTPQQKGPQGNPQNHPSRSVTLNYPSQTPASNVAASSGGANRNFVSPTGPIGYVRIPHRYGHTAPSEGVPLLATAPTIARSWTSSGNFSGRSSGGETYVSGGSSGHVGDSSNASSGSHANSDPTAHDGTDPTAADPTKCDPNSTGGTLDNPSPTARHDDDRSPFANMNGTTPVKLAAGTGMPPALPSDGQWTPPATADGKYGQGGYGKPSFGKPSTKSTGGDSMPTITGPTVDQAVGAPNLDDSLPPDQLATDLSPEKTDDGDTQKLFDGKYGEKSWQGDKLANKSDGGFDADSGDASWQKSAADSGDKEADDTVGSHNFARHGKGSDWKDGGDDSLTLTSGIAAGDNSTLSLSPTLLPIVQATPEPASAALLAASGLLLIRRRRSLKR